MLPTIWEQYLQRESIQPEWGRSSSTFLLLSSTAAMAAPREAPELLRGSQRAHLGESQAGPHHLLRFVLGLLQSLEGPPGVDRGGGGGGDGAAESQGVAQDLVCR